MVEFIRDVFVVVAILLTLIALAFHPSPDTNTGRNADQLSNRISAAGSIRQAGETVVGRTATPTTAAALAK